MRYFFLPAAAALFVGSVMVGCDQTVETASDSNATDPAETTPVRFANTNCPIMGGKPSAELTAEYEGETIGFCCDGCPQKWAALNADDKAAKFAKVDARAGHSDQEGDANE